VSEAGRDYTITKWQRARQEAAAAGRAGPALDELEWTPQDFDAIAVEQTQRENQAAAAGSPLVVCDTDAFVTSVWERRYLGGRAREPQSWATVALPPRDVYLLTSHEGVPWQDDGLREGDLAVRAAMTGWFTTALTAAGHSWVLLTGTLDERLALATRVTDYALENRSRFGASITEGAEAR
jgi:nicotinamide riboside kinase